MVPSSGISRRAFLRLLGVNVAALSLPGFLVGKKAFRLAPGSLDPAQLPEFIRQVLAALPALSIDPLGRLLVQKNGESIFAPAAPTLWNRERRRPVDRLETGHRWGIVLHWFGDSGETDMPLDAYLRGFDAMRPVFNYETRTSAHFLVGGSAPASIADDRNEIGIVQTQEPDSDGTPFLGSHLQALDYASHYEKLQYYVRAFYQLGHTEPGSDSVLQEFFDSPVVIDPNLRTIAIEISGNSFDDSGRLPGVQKIANTVALVWSLMKRYQIQVTDVLGHHEIQLGKSDPGKKFIALVRFLVGILAWIEAGLPAVDLVFARFMPENGDPDAAMQRYFRFVRDYLVLVATAREVFEWEADSRFWMALEALAGRQAGALTGAAFSDPILLPTRHGGLKFLQPENHEGVDLTVPEKISAVQLISTGECLYAGESADPHWKRLSLFRHRLPNGADIVAIYGHLDSLSDIRAGTIYPQQHPVGSIQRPNSYQEAYMHFAVAYGATWDTDLSRHPLPPPNAGTSWIQRRYLDPSAFLTEEANTFRLNMKADTYD